MTDGLEWNTESVFPGLVDSNYINKDLLCFAALLSASFRYDMRLLTSGYECVVELFFFIVIWVFFMVLLCCLLIYSSSTPAYWCYYWDGDERGTERLVSTPPGCRSVCRCCHYCCNSSGGHAVIIWKSISEHPAGLSCSFAVGQYGLSVTTKQLRVDERATMTDVHNQ